MKTRNTIKTELITNASIQNTFVPPGYVRTNEAYNNWRRELKVSRLFSLQLERK